MSQSKEYIDFATVLASAVHDMKNSLLLLSQTIEQLSEIVPKDNQKVIDHFAAAHYEAARLNTGLVQLLSLYRAETENMPINVDECYLEDLIEDLLGDNESYMRHKSIELNIEQQDDLVWYLDCDLIYLLLNDVLINAMRYSEGRMLLKTYVEDGYFCFSVEDDGPGYPSSMLQATTIKIQDFDISQGRTGLGLFFARLIAEGHVQGNRKGSISLSNGGTLGGSVFTLKLP